MYVFRENGDNLGFIGPDDSLLLDIIGQLTEARKYDSTLENGRIDIQFGGLKMFEECVM